MTTTATTQAQVNTEEVVVEAEYTMAWWKKVNPAQRILTGQSYAIAKRVMDITIVACALPLLLPLFAIVALLIWIDSPGAPVLFTQKRTGKDGIRFNMFKFRTMVPNAEAMKQELMHLNELQWPDFKISNDPRITRIGKILRKTSLDELPQLLNVLNGSMSLVGPRPTSFAAETYAPQHLRRLEVTPGLTGLWQIIGRASMEFDERVELDVAYIERRGLALDIMILVKTVTAVLEQRGAC